MRLTNASCSDSMDRRTVVAALPLLGLAAAARPDARELLDRAIAAAGGREALLAARVLRWTGNATVHAGGRSIAIGVDTRVEPFVRARATSWPLDQGRDASRAIVLEPADAWLERRALRLPIPDRMLRHERQQFAIYGLMRLVDLTGPGVALTREGDALRVRHPQAPPTLLRFDSAGRLIGAENQVGSPDGDTPLRQLFRFEGRMPGPIAWPRRIRIEQNGASFFDLTLASFSASPA
jgi:hypothetical protein